MKKIAFIITLLGTISLAHLKFSNNEVYINNLFLENIEALADYEIALDFCMYTSGICTVYSDGLAIKGVLQYSPIIKQ